MIFQDGLTGAFSSNGGPAMAIAPTFQRYLDQHVTYDVIAHEPTMSSMRTAQACHIPGDCLAKAVVLRDDGGYMHRVPRRKGVVRPAGMRNAMHPADLAVVPAHLDATAAPARRFGILENDPAVPEANQVHRVGC
jgi:hypothetical protein